MKRTPITRKTPMARSSSQLRRSAMPRSRPGKQPPERADAAFLAWLRRQPCVMCANPPPSHAHHPRTGAGTSIKAPDATAISLCLVCHHDLHALAGRFRGWLREKLRTWEASCNAMLRAAYEKTKGTA
jgi:hypothetical protein